MKRCFILLFVFLLFNTTALPQVNPDGEAMSLHFLPYVTGGQYQSLDGTLSDGLDNFGFEMKMLIPIGKNFTLSTFYETDLYQYNIQIVDRNKKIPARSGFRQIRYGVGFHVYFH